VFIIIVLDFVGMLPGVCLLGLFQLAPEASDFPLEILFFVVLAIVCVVMKMSLTPTGGSVRLALARNTIREVDATSVYL